MSGLLDPIRLHEDILDLCAGKFLSDPVDLAGDALARFRPPDRISTVDWAERYRRFRTPDGGAMVPYDRWRTPYNIAKMDALDEPGVEMVVIVKPSRSGGTALCENYLAKMIDVGPMGDVGWYLGSDAAVKQYCERVIKPLFEDHPRIAARVGGGRSDDNDASKRINGHLVEWMPANDSHFRNREFLFGVMDEPDGWTRFSESPGTQLSARQKNVGRRRKGVILSHPDKGWKAGTAAEWVTSSRGIFIMRCAECEQFGAAIATKFWPEVPEFRLDYQRNERLGLDDRLDLAARTAGMLCPHCGVILTDEQRRQMVIEAGREGWWMHRGQTLDPINGIIGVPEPHTRRGFYDHGLMMLNVRVCDLGRGLEKARADYERTRGGRLATKSMREFMSKQLGEIFEGKTAADGITAASLRERASEEDAVPEMHFPDEAEFIVAAVDVGAGKFDVSFRAFDLEARSWWLDRRTIRQRLWADGDLRDIRTRERIDDWQVLIDEVLLRRFPIEGDEINLMPVAAVAIDVSDGNVTWIGREFARRSIAQGLYWGTPANPWSIVRLIQGSPSPKTPEIGTRRRINRDERGLEMKPTIIETTLGVHRLKELMLERLAVDDGGPGYCFLNSQIASNYYEELFNEPLIDGRFERQGPNESLDLMAYEEAVRLMLQPDRADLHWDKPEKRPAWARSMPLQPEGGDLSFAGESVPQKTKESVFARIDRMNRRTRSNGRS